MTDVWSADFRLVQIPLKRRFSHAAAVYDVNRSGILVIGRDGAHGIGEGVPREFITGETPEVMLSAIRSLDLRAAGEAILGAPTSSPEEALHRIESAPVLSELRARSPHPLVATACSVELAMLDLLAQARGVTVLDLVRQGAPARIPTIAPGLPRRVLDLASTIEDLGAMPTDTPERIHIKMKASTDLVALGQAVEAVRNRFGDGALVTVDANMSWSLDVALRAAETCARFGVEWFEEPLHMRSWADYAALRAKTGCKILLDESINNRDDAADARNSGAADGVNVRISKSGGFFSALGIIKYAADAGWFVTIGAHVGQSLVLDRATAHLRALIGSSKSIAEGAARGWTDKQPAEDAGPSAKGWGLVAKTSVLDELTEAQTGWKPGATTWAP